MCGIAGIYNFNMSGLSHPKRDLGIMGKLIAHRGPDDSGNWVHANKNIGFFHRRLSIIDLENGQQPMFDQGGNAIVFNGEIYNYIELRKELGVEKFITNSDTEVILQAYRKWGVDCVHRFRGMFSFALWDEQNATLFCARDHFGIKPFYYTVNDKKLYFASEAKALLPFVAKIETDTDALKDYLSFQLTLDGKTMFKNIRELKPAHMLTVQNGNVSEIQYWEIYYQPDYDHTKKYFIEKLQEYLEEAIKIHIRSDVPVGAYVSGGIDSSMIASLANRNSVDKIMGFTGKFTKYGNRYDESRFAKSAANWSGYELMEVDIGARDFIENIEKVIYHLDYPVAGPGSFSQYMVSKLASQHRKVVLGGQGGDEIFGGYARYLIAYFEQCIKAAIDGKMDNGNFIVTYESIIPNLHMLQKYKPMLQEFWREGLFEEMDRRYFRLINRSNNVDDQIRWNLLGDYNPFDTFRNIFHSRNVGKKSYFDLMTHFDFKTLLPGLLQVEDRMSMAHGLESRVPLLDKKVVEFSTTIPSNIKFENGNMKHIFKKAISGYLPDDILERKDKMGFPTPVMDWINGEAHEWVYDIFSSQKALERDYIDNRAVLKNIANESEFGRAGWGFLSLELWQRRFHDREHDFKKLLTEQ